MESPLLVTRRGIEITDYVIISGEVNGVKADLSGFSFWLTHHYNLRSRLSRMTCGENFNSSPEIGIIVDNSLD